MVEHNRAAHSVDLDSVTSWRTPIESVNFHVWQPCNMHCRFCFARFLDVRNSILPAGHLACDDALRVVAALADAGFQKINFAGGEPLLCPWLPDLISAAKSREMTTSIVTNGLRIDPAFFEDLHGELDWLTLSIDSAEPGVLLALGRAEGKSVLSPTEAIEVCNLARRASIRLKINTVVTKLNVNEDLTQFIIAARPDRWKIMQVLPVSGQNDRSIKGLTVTVAEFQEFTARHRWLESKGVHIVDECNADMTGSYVMVDPGGRFFDNVDSRHNYSNPILQVGVRSAFEQVRVDRGMFLERGGLYDWRR